MLTLAEIESRLTTSLMTGLVNNMGSARFAEALRALLNYPVSDEQLDLLQRFWTGGFELRNFYVYGVALQFRDEFWKGVKLLLEHGRLTTGAMVSLFQQTHYLVGYSINPQRNHAHFEIPEIRQEFMTAFEAAVEDCLADPSTPDRLQFLAAVHHYRAFLGSRYVLYAAQAAARAKPSRQTQYSAIKLMLFGTEKISDLITLFAGVSVSDLDTPAKKAEFIAQLRELPAEPMKMLLPHARFARDLLIEAFGFERFKPLLDVLNENSGGSFNGFSTDSPNCGDERSGVIDVQAVRQAGEALGGDAKPMLDAYIKSHADGSRTASIFLAAMGYDRKAIEKKLVKHDQLAIKAYGALPLADGESALDRWNHLKRMHSEAGKYGSERRANTRAAVGAAIHNLAQVAGYRDADTMESHFEAKSFLLAQTSWEIGGYTLELDPASGALNASNAEKSLKTIPAAVRKTPQYEEARALSQALRRQISRIRRDVLEARMASGVEFGADEIAGLWSFAAARPMMSALVWINADGANGLLSDDGATLAGLDGHPYPADAPLRLAHPFDLYSEGTLAAWQKRVVQIRLVQPFKQVFRELYILTPAETATATYSNRFANHVVIAATANKLFESRGWTLERRDQNMLFHFKVVNGVRAAFPFDGVSYFFGGPVPVTSSRIVFSDAAAPLKWDWQTKSFVDLMRLEDVPPLFFSETMRDADLVTAVAQADTSGFQISAESFAARGAVVSTLIEDLGLPNVTVDGHFARVTGKRAGYRVHLGNAAIHIDPGNYLCIVPDRALKPAETIYLPFAEEGDRKVSEVVSKILLLLNDDKITDPSILIQLTRQ